MPTPVCLACWHLLNTSGKAGEQETRLRVIIRAVQTTFFIWIVGLILTSGRLLCLQSIRLHMQFH